MRNGEGRVTRSELLEECSGGDKLNIGAEFCLESNIIA